MTRDEGSVPREFLGAAVEYAELPGNTQRVARMAPELQRNLSALS